MTIKKGQPYNERFKKTTIRGFAITETVLPSVSIQRFVLAPTTSLIRNQGLLTPNTKAGRALAPFLFGKTPRIGRTLAFRGAPFFNNPEKKLPKVEVGVSKRDSSYYTDKDKVVSITYEEIGLFPRSFSRVLDRFLKQLFSDVDNLVIQEYRFYRYLFLTTIKTIFILLWVPLLVNFMAKNYVVKPVTEYFWNTQHPEIFLNSYEQKRAFAELEKFEEKIYFETLVQYNNYATSSGDYTGEYQTDGKDLTPNLNSNLPPGYEPGLLNGRLKPYYSSSEDIGVSPNKTFATEHSSAIASLHPRSYSQTPVGSAMGEGNIKEGIKRSDKGFEDLNIKLSPGMGESDGNVLPLSNNARSLSPSARSVSDGNTVLIMAGSEPSGALSGRDPGRVRVQLSKDVFKLYGEKTIELATYYNNHSIEAITNFFADLLSLCALLYLLVTLEIQINITKSFLAEVFFGLDDSKKSLLILLVTDLLVGYHSSNLWELFFGFIFNHYGIPESQTGIFLLVATLPVLLDVLFKYLIFRHLNRSSPATVATYQAIIE